MWMPVSAAGDQSLGHSFTPSPITPTIANVLVSGKPVHSVGDIIAIHVLGNSAHLGAIGFGSTTVFASGKGVARLMDKGDCGAMILGSVGNVLVGG